jgi:tRNA dimethylallyltransferase
MSESQPNILAIVGPTSSGKSALALAVAEQFGAEIVSADSRQLYRYLNIGTAKPSSDEMRKVKHHFVDILDPPSDYSAGQFGTEARLVLAHIVGGKKLPILVGGSGLYLTAVLDGLFNGPGRDDEIRLQLEEKLEKEGLAALVNTLRSVDPKTAQLMKEITARRVIRALEVYRITGKPLSQLQFEEAPAQEFEAYQVGLLWERKELYERIDERVERMLASGLVDEVKGLMAKGYTKKMNALNTVGYKEVFDFLEGSIDHEEMKRLIKRNTRRFAKRQMTWFRRDPRIVWMRVSGDAWLESCRQRITEAVKKRFRRHQM